MPVWAQTCQSSGQTCRFGTSSYWASVITNATAVVSGTAGCRRVTNNAGRQLFIPLTDAGWLSYVTHPPDASLITTVPCTCQGAVSWNVSGKQCDAVVGTAVAEGASAPVTDGSANNTGSAPSSYTTGSSSFQCLNGIFTQSGGTCVQQCPAQTLSWTVGSDTCSASAAQTAYNGSAGLTDSIGPATGAATFACSNGTWGGATGASCASVVCTYAGTSSTGTGGASPQAGCKCNNGGETWCSTTVACETTVTCTYGGTSTSGLGQAASPAGCFCNGSGQTWNGSSCISPCSSTTLGWNSNCSGTIAAASSGVTNPVTNSAGGYNGSASYNCNNGSWNLQGGATCNTTGLAAFNFINCSSVVGPNPNADNQYHTMICPYNKVVTAFSVYASNRLDGNGTLTCCEISGATLGTVNNYAGTASGNADGVPHSVICPSGQLMTGYSVYATSRWDYGDSIYCAPIASPANTGIAVSATQGVFYNSCNNPPAITNCNWDSQTHYSYCNANEAMVAVSMDTGSFMDNFNGIQCAKAGCVGSTVNWTVGGLSCSAAIGSAAYGSSAYATDSTAPYGGTANFTCTNGAWTGPAGGATCQVAGPCAQYYDGYSGYFGICTNDNSYAADNCANGTDSIYCP